MTIPRTREEYLAFLPYYPDMYDIRTPEGYDAAVEEADAYDNLFERSHRGECT